MLCRPDEYEDFENDPRARQIVGREALELARAFAAKELIVAGDAASDFLGTEANTWPMDAMDDQPAARKVLTLTTEGDGIVVDDNSDAIARLLRDSALHRGDTAVLEPNGRPALAGGDGGCSVVTSDALSTLAGQAALWSLALGLVARRRRR